MVNITFELHIFIFFNQVFVFLLDYLSFVFPLIYDITLNILGWCLPTSFLALYALFWMNIFYSIKLALFTLQKSIIVATERDFPRRAFQTLLSRVWIKSSGKTSQNVIEFLFMLGLRMLKWVASPGFGNLEVFIIK